MDVRFLKTISEAYIIQHSLQNKHTIDELFEDVYSLIKELRDTDIDLYDHLYDAPKLQQQGIISKYFDYQYGETIEEFGLLIPEMVLGAILSYLYAHKMTKAIFNFGDKFGRLMKKLGQFLTKKGRYWQFRYAIIEKNVEKCYKQCGVNDSDIRSSHYFSTGSKPGMISSVKGYEQGRCLAKCYVGYVIEAISLLCKSYFVCLRKTGDFSKVQNLRPDDILKVLSGLRLSNSCIDYFQEMRDLFNEFNDLLDHVYGEDEQEKRIEVQRLQNKMLQAKNEIVKSRNMQQFN